MNGIEKLHLLLTKFKKAIRIWYFTTGVCYVLVAVALVFFVNLFLDRVFLFDWIQRLICLILGISFVLFVFYKNLISPLFSKINDEYLCHAIEARRPELGQIISSGYQFANIDQPEVYGYSNGLIEVAIKECIEATESVNTKELIDNKLKYKLYLCGLFAVGLFYMFIFNFSNEFSIWMQRNILLQNIKWPKKTVLKIENLKAGNKIYVPEGDSYDLMIKADTAGQIPDLIKIKIIENNESSFVTTNLKGINEYNFRFEKISNNVSFIVYGGDDESELVQIETIKKPEINNIQFICNPPEYTGLASYPLDYNQSSWLLLENSKLTISGKATKKLSKLEVYFNNILLQIKVVNINETNFTFSIESALIKSGIYQIQIYDEIGITKKPGYSFSIVVVPDKFPEINSKWLYNSDLITQNARIPCQWNAKDDYGLAKVDLLLYIINKDESSEEVARASLFKSIDKTVKEQNKKLEVRISDYSIKINQQILIYLEAYDFLMRPSISFGRSNVMRLTLVSDEEFEKYIFGKEQELSIEIERIIKEMEEYQIVVAGVLENFTQNNLLDNDDVKDLNNIEKKQKLVEQKNNRIISRFTFILNDMEINQLNDEKNNNKLRIEKKIIEPLQAINNSYIPLALQLALGARVNNDKTLKLKALNDLIKSQANIILEYSKILKVMKKWEGYYETVGLLKEIIKEQKNLKDKTENNKKENIKGVFDE
jgi:hypothetical protein